MQQVSLCGVNDCVGATMNLIELQTFILVASAGTMKEAASRLGVPTSTVSRRVARLEDELGVELLRRAHRSFALTEQGQQLFVRSAPLLDELDSVAAAVVERDSEPRGLLRVTAPQDLGTTPFVSELFARFMVRWPQVQLHVELTTRMISLAEEGYDAALRPHMSKAIPGEASLRGRRLGRHAISFYASCAYLSAQGAPTSPGELSEHRTLGMATQFSSGPGDLTLRHADQGVADTSVVWSPDFRSNDFALLAAMTRAGAGICALPSFLARPMVRDGLISPVLPQWHLNTGSITLLWPHRRHLPARLRVFLDFVTEAFAASEDFLDV